jgi:hypothetical protein
MATAETILIRASHLLQHAVDLVPVLELEHFGSLIALDDVPVQDEAHRRLVDALSIGVRLEDLLCLKHGGTKTEGMRCQTSQGAAFGWPAAAAILLVVCTAGNAPSFVVRLILKTVSSPVWCKEKNWK